MAIEVKKDSKGILSPQELSAQQLPVGAVPGLPIIVWDHRNNQYGVLNQGFLAELCLLAEKAYTNDRLDSRNGKGVTVKSGAAVNDVVTGVIEVPAGEVWYINQLSVVCPPADATGSAKFNILVSSFPKVDTADKAYLPDDVTAMGTVTSFNLRADGQLGEELRLVGGDKLTLRLTVTVAHTTDKDYRLNISGRKGKRIV